MLRAGFVFVFLAASGAAAAPPLNGSGLTLTISSTSPIPVGSSGLWLDTGRHLRLDNTLLPTVGDVFGGSGNWTWSTGVHGNPSNIFAWKMPDAYNPWWLFSEQSSAQTTIPNYLNGLVNVSTPDPQPDAVVSSGFNCGPSADPTKSVLCQTLESHYVDASGNQQQELHFTWRNPTAPPWNGTANFRYFDLVGNENTGALAIALNATQLSLGTGSNLGNAFPLLSLSGNQILLQSLDTLSYVVAANSGLRLSSNGITVTFANASLPSPDLIVSGGPVRAVSGFISGDTLAHRLACDNVATIEGAEYTILRSGATATAKYLCQADGTGTLSWVPLGGPSFPLFATDGTLGAPSFAFASEHTLGLRRVSAALLGVVADNGLTIQDTGGAGSGLKAGVVESYRGGSEGVLQADDTVGSLDGIGVHGGTGDTGYIRWHSVARSAYDTTLSMSGQSMLAIATNDGVTGGGLSPAKVAQDVASLAGATTIATFTPTVSGLYRVSIVVSAHTNNDTVTCQITYTDAVESFATTLTPISAVALVHDANTGTTSSSTLIRASTGSNIVAKISTSAQTTTKASATIERLN